MHLFAHSKYPSVLPFGGKAGKPKLCSKKRAIHCLAMVLKVMKITAVILLATCLQVAAAGYGQNKITLSEKDAPVERIFTLIRKQTGFQFLYANQVIAQARRVTIQVKNADLEDVLAVMFEGQPFDYQIKEKTVIVRMRVASAANPSASDKHQPPIDVKGKVINDKGEPIAGATIIVEGTKKSTVTDANGEFAFTGVNENAILQISHVQYEGDAIILNSRSIVNATLHLKVSSLDEMQVIAYGTTTKRLNTGNVSIVKASDIERQPVGNPLQALQGRVPGMVVTQLTGVPGGGFTVQIRGRNSIINGLDPLYVIDGVPYISQLLPNVGYNMIGAGNPLNYLNTNDIESISVLKDADATAIYGSRAANGVILITTKKAKEGKTNIDFNFYQGVGNIERRISFLNSDEYLAMRKEAYANDGMTPTGSSARDILMWNPTSYTDWQKKLVGGTAGRTNAGISVSGGNANTQYVIGGNFQKESTVFPSDFSDQKASVHFNVTGKSSNQKFKITLSGNYLADDNNLLYLDFTQYVSLPPNTPPVFNDDGTLNWENGTFTGNPFIYMARQYKNRSTNLISNTVVSYELIKGLDIKASLGYNSLQLKEIQKYPSEPLRNFPGINNPTGSTDFNNSNITSWIIEPQITYGVRMDEHKLNALVGTTFQKNESNGEIIYGTGYLNDALLESLQGAVTVTKGAITDQEYKYNSVFGRINYDYKNKYLLNISIRRDGSSRYGLENRFANFWSLGTGWVFSNEDFIQKNAHFLSFGKLRASYGTTGNDQIGDYRYLELFNVTVNNPYQGGQGLFPNNLPVPAYSWEEIKKLEGGIELGFINDRILLSASYFRNRSSNQVINYQLPTVTGFTGVTANLPAVVQNDGWEFTLNTSNLRTKAFAWNSSFNLTFSKNKLVNFPNFENTTYGLTYVIGKSLNIKQLYNLNGVDPTTGVYQFLDRNGNTTFDPSSTMDRISLVNTDPQYYGGFQNNFKYKSFELDFLFQFVKQIGLNYLFYDSRPPGTFNVNWPTSINNRWQKPGQDAPIQKFTRNAASDAYRAYGYARESNYAYTDASFIRLKNVSLSYHLPDKWIRKLALNNFKVYLQGQNLLTITNYEGLDPESQNGASLPPVRMVVVGIQLGL